MSYDKNVAYNDLPLLPPKEELETKAILKKVGDAKAALAELRGWMITQANPMLLLESISLQEAKASSEIENIVTTNDEIYRAFITPELLNVSPAVKEVMHYKEALWYAYNKIINGFPLTINLMIDLFHIVKERGDGIRSLPGTRLANSHQETVYTPPDNPDDIMRLLDNLEIYINMNADNIDPLIKLAIIHYQFESIHPFPDGNGRVGRLINVLYLVQQKLLKFPILYLSRHIIENKTDYYNNLKKVTENRDWEGWILYMLNTIEMTAQKTLTTIQKIYQLESEYTTKIKTEFPNIYSAEIVNALFERPYCKINSLMPLNIATAQTISRYLRTLTAAGMLECVKVGRENYYINTALLAILKK